eukprot:TRINITY_DN28025_c0_g1_i1.p1 TRINITY_DN28025_c0_g1~~TRINITY_DN28025_c0_g1_i1.p1  ORF type:complete len:455 (+),score=128.19 TRINITY_DN28025_c0_g1_i1:51-1415(+)
MSVVPYKNPGSNASSSPKPDEGKQREILDKFGCETVAELHRKMTNLCMKNGRVNFEDSRGSNPWPYTLEKMLELGLDHPGLDYMLNRVQAEDDLHKVVKQVVADLRKLKKAPTTTRDPDLTPSNDFYDAYIKDNMICMGVDAPGSYHAPLGLGYFNEFFMSMFLGNYSDFEEIFQGMVLHKDMRKVFATRYGYLKLTPIFVPISGLRMGCLSAMYDKKTVREVETMYPRQEGEHLKIFKMLLHFMELCGAGHMIHKRDITGKTALFHALYTNSKDALIMACMLLERGVDPNVRDKYGNCLLGKAIANRNFQLAWVLVHHKADPYVQPSNFEVSYVIEIAAQTANMEALEILLHAKRKEDKREYSECAKCKNSASKKCGGCRLVWYCTPSCQAANWRVHKPVCRLAQKDHPDPPLPHNLPLSAYLLAKREVELSRPQEEEEEEDHKFSERFWELD